MNPRLSKIVRKKLAETDWLAEIMRLRERARKIDAYREGRADVRVIHVGESKWVKRHKRSAHDRIVFVLREKK